MNNSMEQKKIDNETDHLRDNMFFRLILMQLNEPGIFRGLLLCRKSVFVRETTI